MSRQADNIRPPSTGNNNEVALVAGVASAFQTLSPVPSLDDWFTIAVDTGFNILFGTSGVASPSNIAIIPPGVYDVCMIDVNSGDKVTGFKITAPAAGNLKWWKSSY